MHLDRFWKYYKGLLYFHELTVVGSFFVSRAT